MKFFGIVSYNIYCNFTNYGSALQSWALSQAINKIGKGRWQSKLIDYCPDVLADKDPLNPFSNMWDTDEESRQMCMLTMPAIRKNYIKFNEFYHNRFLKTEKKYTSANFNDVVEEEQINGFVCGSDTIFCIDEFKGFDDGYYANYDCMKNGYTISYAASFGDIHLNEETYKILNNRLQNFKALGIREKVMIPYVKSHTSVAVERTIDPTLLLTREDYDTLAVERIVDEKYLLLYVRRYNKEMEKFAEDLARQKGLKIVEISLRATNAEKGHQMFYEAGVEEYLSLVKYADVVVSNSFHGLIFAVQYCRPIYIFSREQADSKVGEVLEVFGLEDRLMVSGTEQVSEEIDYEKVHNNIEPYRRRAFQYLESALEKCPF